MLYLLDHGVRHEYRYACLQMFRREHERLGLGLGFHTGFQPADRPVVRAVILAAGSGNRLKQLGNQPKCLLEFGGATLLQRHLKALAGLQIDDVTICLGYKAGLIMDALERSPFTHVRCVFNSAFREGSVVSLWTTRETLRGGDDVLLMDADVLYTPIILERLVSNTNANCFLLDRDFVAGDEPVKLCLRDGMIVEFRKQLDPALRYSMCGESVGFFKFSPEAAGALATMTDYYVDKDRREAPYEEALRDLVLQQPQDYGVEDITGLPWVEIDFPQDVTLAREDILPAIDGS